MLASIYVIEFLSNAYKLHVIKCDIQKIGAERTKENEIEDFCDTKIRLNSLIKSSLEEKSECQVQINDDLYKIMNAAQASDNLNQITDQITKLQEKLNGLSILSDRQQTFEHELFKF